MDNYAREVPHPWQNLACGARLVPQSAQNRFAVVAAGAGGAGARKL